MDRYPGPESGVERPNWVARNATVKELINRGWADKLMLGHDYAARPEQPRDHPTRYLFLSTTAIPALIADGVPEATIDLMMRTVPRRFLTGESS